MSVTRGLTTRRIGVYGRRKLGKLKYKTMPNRPNNPTRFRFGNIRNRLAAFALKNSLGDFARNILQNEFEETARFWFIQGGGVESDFEQKFNEK